MKEPFVTAAVVALILTLSPVASSQSDLATELEQAKDLYKNANFIRALQALGAVVRVLDERPDEPNAEAMRIDGHLHLGLTYFALKDTEAAKESFERVLALRPSYTLDPNVYPPSVRALFDEVRAEVDISTAVPDPRAPEPPAIPEINPFELLYRNWAFFAPLDGDPERITREDLEAFQESPDVARQHSDLAAASALFLENPVFFDRADVGKGNRFNLGGSGDLDGEISQEDLRACLDWGARKPLGRFDPANPTPEDAAGTFLHWFEFLDIGAGRGEIDGLISYRDLEDFLARNPKAPAELRSAVRYVLDNPVVLAQLDSAADSDGEIDERISLADLERVRS